MISGRNRVKIGSKSVWAEGLGWVGAGGVGPGGRVPVAPRKVPTLEYFDVMDMKSRQEKIIPPEFSDVMIAYVVGGEARDANPTNYEK